MGRSSRRAGRRAQPSRQRVHGAAGAGPATETTPQCCGEVSEKTVSFFFIGDAEDALDYDVVDDAEEHWEIVDSDEDSFVATPRTSDRLPAQPFLRRERRAGPSCRWADLESDDEGTSTKAQLSQLPTFLPGGISAQGGSAATQVAMTALDPHQGCVAQVQAVVSVEAREPAVAAPRSLGKSGKGKGTARKAAPQGRVALAEASLEREPVVSVAGDTASQGDVVAVEAAPSRAELCSSAARPPGDPVEPLAETASALDNCLCEPKANTSGNEVTQRTLADFLCNQSARDVAFLGAILGVGTDAESVAAAIMSASATGSVPAGSFLAAAASFSASELELLKRSWNT